MEPLPGVALRDLALPFAPPIRLRVVADPPALIDPAVADQDVYWGELWPASVALADAVLAGALALPAGDGAVLDLGCGVGLATIACARRGASVVCADRAPEALALTLANARADGVADRVRARRVDWREPYAQRHALVLACDCLYLAEMATQVLAFCARAVADGGRAVLVDPDRVTARTFAQRAQEAGWSVRATRRAVPFVAAHGALATIVAAPPRPLAVTLYELTRASS